MTLPRPRETSLRWRLAAGLFTAMACVSGSLALYYQLRISGLVSHEADARIDTLAKHLGHSAVLGVLAASEELLQPTLKSALLDRDVLAVRVYDTEGTTIAALARPGYRREPRSMTAVDAGCRPCTMGDATARWLVPVTRQGTSAPGAEPDPFYGGEPGSGMATPVRVGWLQLDVSTARRQQQARALLWHSMAIAAAVLLVGLLLTLLLSRRFVEPLRALARATREVGQGKWDVPIPDLGQGEIHKLASDFRAMTRALAALDNENKRYRSGLEAMVEKRTEELRQAYHKMKEMVVAKDQFVATVSHDFRSPLAIVLSALQTVRVDRDMPHDTRQRFLDRAERHVKRLQAMVGDLLDLARMENRDATVELTNLPALVRECLESRRSDAADKGVELTIEQSAPVDAPVAVDRGLVERAVANLIDNALKFTEAEGRVTARLEQCKGWTTVIVRDTGVGIPQEELPRVFERFFQGEGKQSRGLGSGLGLAIVWEVARKHGGTVEVQSAPGRGSTFELRLPFSASRKGAVDADDSGG